MTPILLVVLAALPVNTGRRGVPVDECGAPVRDAAGRNIEYSLAEKQARPCANANAPGKAGPPPGRSLLPRPQTAVRGFGFYGSGIGLSNIVVAPVPPAPGLGPVEIYLGGTSSTFGYDDYWHALRYSSVRHTYEDVFVSEAAGEGFSAGIARIAVGDVAGDSRLEIVVALRSGEIRLHDQLTKRALHGFATGLDELEGLALRDLDGDGKAEILATSDDELRVFKGGTLAWQLGVGGHDVVVGQMDGDPALEIAVTGGAVVDAASRSVQWTWPDGFGVDLETADIDGDGREELVAAEPWYFVWAYDVDTQLPKWSIPIELDIGAIRLANVDADPTIELLVGEGQWGSVLAFDTVTQAREWAVENPAHGVTYVAVGNVDGDPALELLWGAGATSTGEDHLYVCSLATHEIEWQNVHLDGPIVGPAYGDVDGDGRPELVLASTTSNSGYDSGRVLVLDAETLAVRGLSPESVLEGWTGLHDLKLRNVDADPALEIVIATDYLYDGLLRIYDFDGPSGTFAERWTNLERPEGSPFYSVEVADIDRDGTLEVVAGGGREHTGADGVFVYVFDLATGATRWRSFQLGGYWSYVPALAVLSSGAGNPHVAALVGEGSIYIFDGITRSPVQIIPGSFTSLDRMALASSRGLLAGTSEGAVHLYQRSGGTYALHSSLALGPEPIDGAHPLDKDGTVAVGWGGRLALLRWPNPSPLWTSADYGEPLGRSLAGDAQNLYAGGGYALLGFPRQPPPGPNALKR